MFRRLRARIHLLLHGGDFNRDLDEEMSFHIDRLAEDLMRRGMDPETARREARMRFGSTQRTQARAREERGFALFDEAGRNLRFALRGMVRSPLFSITSILTLALCIGLGASVFSVVDAVLWRPLPYPHPEDLALVGSYIPAYGNTPDQTGVDGRMWERIRDESTFERAVYGGTHGVNLTSDRAAVYVQQQRVGAGYFHVLGVPPELGREFTVAEDVPGGPDVAILSHGLWTRTFSADSHIIGHTIRLKGKAYTVVGVMPADFRSDVDAGVWTPLRPTTTGEGGGVNYSAIVRFPQAMTFQEADARVGAIEPPSGSSDKNAANRRFGLVPLNRALTAGLRLPMLILLAGIVLMLVVGCANIAGLQIARSLARQSEIATRQALGGGAGALVRQMVAENLLLGFLGGAAGLGVAYAMLSGLRTFVQSQFDIWQNFGMDRLALGVVLSLTLLATVLFGLAPVIRVMRPAAQRALVSGARGAVGGASHLLRKVLLVGEVAVVTALLFGAGLLVRYYGHLEGLDPGFDPHGVLTVQLSLDDARYAGAEQVRQLFDQSLAGIRGIPGVSAAGVGLTLPYERALNYGFHFPEEDQNTYHITDEVYTTPGYFAALGIPVVQGRAFDEGDEAGQQSVVLVNQAFVARYLTDRQALGTMLTGPAVEGRTARIVGVVGNVQQKTGWGGADDPVWQSPTLYVPAGQMSGGFFQGIHIWFSPEWIVKSGTSRADLMARVLQVFRTVAPDLPVARVASLDQVMGQAFAKPRFEAGFLLVVAAFALLLAGIGLYGIVAHEVVQRRSEMGLRMALGSSPGRAVWTAGSTGVRLTLMGFVLGAALSVVVDRVVAHAIFGVAPYDTTTLLVLGSVLAPLALVTAFASFVPAARVGRMHPADILREV